MTTPDQEDPLPVPQLTADLELLLPGASNTDWVLEELVDLVNRSQAVVSITLLVQGALVSGDLISVKQFYEAYGQMWFDGTKGNDLGKRLKQRWVQIGQAQGENLAKADINALPRYLHLKNARYYFGAVPVPGGDGFLWRGRISEVGAFSMGSLGGSRAT